ncbi:hypothetical protein J6590_056049 [Homalodisca vitripennis]|nr:hypothetical protein J6590_056049 [Homalodisca vitripennis]
MSSDCETIKDRVNVVNGFKNHFPTSSVTMDQCIHKSKAQYTTFLRFPRLVQWTSTSVEVRDSSNDHIIIGVYAEISTFQ